MSNDSGWKSVVIPKWAYTELGLLRALIIQANETGSLPKEVVEYLQAKKKEGEVSDPYARGSIIGIVCLLARRALNSNPGFEPGKVDQRVISQERSTRRNVIVIDGEEIFLQDDE